MSSVKGTIVVGISRPSGCGVNWIDSEDRNALAIQRRSGVDGRQTCDHAGKDADPGDPSQRPRRTIRCLVPPAKLRPKQDPLRGGRLGLAASLASFGSDRTCNRHERLARGAAFDMQRPVGGAESLVRDGAFGDLIVHEVLPSRPYPAAFRKAAIFCLARKSMGANAGFLQVDHLRDLAVGELFRMR